MAIIDGDCTVDLRLTRAVMVRARQVHSCVCCSSPLPPSTYIATAAATTTAAAINAMMEVNECDVCELTFR
jgi:hypothetical protein